VLPIAWLRHGRCAITKPPGLRVTGGLPHGNSCRVSESREFWLLAIHIVVVAADHRHVADRLNFGEQRPIADI